MQEDSNSSSFQPSIFQPYDPSQEPIFPPELKLNHDQYFTTELKFQSESMLWFRPTNISRLLEMKSKYPEAKIPIGFTELAIDINFKGLKAPIMIYPTAIKELKEVVITEDSIILGAALTQSCLEEKFAELIAKMDKSRTKILVQMMEMYKWFAGKQIKNVSSIGGNIITGSPISDLNPILMVVGTKLKLSSCKGTRIVPLDDQFYANYRTTILRDDEILVSMEIPFTKASQYVYAYKQSRRRNDDVSIVNAALFFEIQDSLVSECRMAFGGMGKTVAVPVNSINAIQGASGNLPRGNRGLTYLFS